MTLRYSYIFYVIFEGIALHAQVLSRDALSTLQGNRDYYAASQARGVIDEDFTGTWHATVVGAEQIQTMAYAVVAIHPLREEDLPRRTCLLSYSPTGELRCNCTKVVELIAMAWGINASRILGGPNWIRSDWYSVEAKNDEDLKALVKEADQVSGREIRTHLLQELLVDRFHLKVHKETRQLPVLALEVGKKGAKLREVSRIGEGKNAAGETIRVGYAREYGPGKFDASRAKLTELALYLEMQYQQVVVDRTNLNGYYDYKIQWSPEVETEKPQKNLASDPGRPPLSIALEEQLGLKLVAAKAPVEVVVIDGIERPTEN